LLTHGPPDGVYHIALSAPVGPYNGTDSGRNGNIQFLHEGLETNGGKFFNLHIRDLLGATMAISMVNQPLLNKKYLKCKGLIPDSV
jgi:hypothetical protein